MEQGPRFTTTTVQVTLPLEGKEVFSFGGENVSSLVHDTRLTTTHGMFLVDQWDADIKPKSIVLNVERCLCQNGFTRVKI